MGKLLLFARGNRPESEQVDPKKDAELVMFTGVRYERHDADENDRNDKDTKRKNGG